MWIKFSLVSHLSLHSTTYPPCKPCQDVCCSVLCSPAAHNPGMDSHNTPSYLNPCNLAAHTLGKSTSFVAHRSHSARARVLTYSQQKVLHWLQIDLGGGLRSCQNWPICVVWLRNLPICWHLLLAMSCGLQWLDMKMRSLVVVRVVGLGTPWVEWEFQGGWLQVLQMNDWHFDACSQVHTFVITCKIEFFSLTFFFHFV